MCPLPYSSPYHDDQEIYKLIVIDDCYTGVRSLERPGVMKLKLCSKFLYYLIVELFSCKISSPKNLTINCALEVIEKMHAFDGGHFQCFIRKFKKNDR